MARNRIILRHHPELSYVPIKNWNNLARIDHALGIPSIADLLAISEELRDYWKDHDRYHKGNADSWFYGLLGQRAFARMFHVRMKQDHLKKGPSFTMAILDESNGQRGVSIDVAVRTKAPWELHLNEDRSSRATIVVAGKLDKLHLEVDLVGWYRSDEIVNRNDVRTHNNPDGRKPSVSYAVQHGDLRPMDQLRAALIGDVVVQAGLF